MANINYTKHSATAAAEDLWDAIENEDSSLVELILQNINVPKCNFLNQIVHSRGMTLLHLAVGLNSLSIVQILLNYGANPNSLQCEDKASPLHLSVMYEHEKIIKALMDAGGNPLLEDGEHKNCFNYIKEQELDHLSEYLMPRESTNKLQVSLTEPNNKNESANSSTSTATFYSCNSSLDQTESKENAFKDKTKETGDLILVPALEKIILDTGSTNKNLKIKNTVVSVNSTQQIVISEPKVSSPVLSPGFTSITKRSAAYFSSPETTPIQLQKPQLQYLRSGSNNKSPTDFLKVEEKNSKIVALETTWDMGPLANKTGINSILCPYEFTDDDTIFSGTTTSSNSNSVISATETDESTSDEKSVASNESEWKPRTYQPPTGTELENLKTMVKESRIPVTSSTYSILAKLAKSPEKKNIVIAPASERPKGFSPELQYGIKNMTILDSWGHNVEIQSTNIHNGERRSKSYFNYLLLDPKLTKRTNFNSKNNLKTNVITNSEKFDGFLNSIFYIGKGHAKRPIQHLIEAKKLRELSISKLRKLTASEKSNKILEIWECGQGVIVLSICNFSSEKEACVKEASMIDAIGINCQELTNIVKGSYSGTLASSWTQKKKNQYGAFLLYKAFCTFVFSETHKEFFPNDIQV